MTFNSFTFLLFLLIVVSVTRLKWSWRGKKAFLLLMSYLFYAAWNPPFVVLLWISTLGDWFFARWMYRTENRLTRRTCLFASLVLNLGLLAYFKYGTFVLENFTILVQSLGVDWSPAAPNIILPVGISFYTFQTLSYTIDIYRRQAKPCHSFLDYALFVTFFPQLVAGPIVRATEFLPQCEEPKRATSKQLGWGLSLFVIGFFNKVVIADVLMAPVVEEHFRTGVMPGFLDAWVGTLAFSTQIFCDFSGYSTCAIGVALCLGFALPRNFLFPYAAIGFSDFWRRWHISLSTWLRDYLYIPLGGNRGGEALRYRNLATTMLLGGLWHGASWTFLVWGGLHGIYLVIERLLDQYMPKSRLWSFGPIQFLLGVATYVSVCYAWVFFRAKNFTDAWNIVLGMSGIRGWYTTEGQEIASPHGPFFVYIIIAVSMGTVALHWCLRNTTLETVATQMPWWLTSIILASLIFLTMLCWGGEDRAFIYFQF